MLFDRRLARFFDRNALGFAAVLFVLYVLLFVEQVSAIWLELPLSQLLRDDWLKGLGFCLFVLAVVATYLNALWVIRTDQVRDEVKWLGESLSKWTRMRALPAIVFLLTSLLLLIASLLAFRFSDELSWWGRPLAALAGSLPLLLPTLPLAALAAAVVPAIGRSFAKKGRLRVAALLLLVAAGNVAVRQFYGPSAESHRFYPLAGMACITFGFLFGLTGFWFIVLAFWGPAPGNLFGRPTNVAGRLLSVTLLSVLAGEVTWALASSWDTLVSYRVYTIVTLFQVSFVIIGLASLVDVCHRATGWPIRQTVITGGAVYLLFWLQPSHVSSPKTIASPVDTRGWYEHFEARLRAMGKAAGNQGGATTDERYGPVVFVAASGGGSRAAYFTALVLEALAAEKMTDGAGAPFVITRVNASPRDATWADQIALMSSVSGGSLAVAYYAHADAVWHRLPTPWPDPRQLRNSFGIVLAKAAEDRYQSERRDRYKSIWKGVARYQEDKDYKERVDKAADDETTHFYVDGDPQNSAPLWMIASRFGDDTCTDFMAPLLRAVLAPTMDRGTSLSRFWEQRFQWEGTTNLDGYSAKGYGNQDGDESPLILFNATHARLGTRLVVGFPPLAADMLGVKPDLAPAKATPATKDDEDSFRQLDPRHYHTQTIEDMDPTYRIRLADAVRLSANFPWGIPTARLRPAVGDELPWDVLDGGVNDNSGIPALWEVIQHLDDMCQVAMKKHPAHPRAKRILTELRRRGVVFVEIDSGAKPTFASQSELFTPTQALNNAAYAKAGAARGWYLDRLQQLLDPRQEALAADTIALPRKRAGRPFLGATELAVEARYPAMFVQQFTCNHSDEDDVMTAWALAPSHKSQIVSTLFCEHRQWREIDMVDYKGWMKARDASAKPGAADGAPWSTPQSAPANLHHYQNEQAEMKGAPPKGKKK